MNVCIERGYSGLSLNISNEFSDLSKWYVLKLFTSCVKMLQDDLDALTQPLCQMKGFDLQAILFPLLSPYNRLVEIAFFPFPFLVLEK